MKLYEIANDYLECIESIDFDIVDEKTGEIIDPLALHESLSESFSEKAVAVTAYIKGIEAKAEAIREAENAMEIRRKHLEKRAKSLRAYLLLNMQRCGFEKVEHAFFEIGRGKNPPSVEIINEKEIPAKFKNVELVTKIDKIAIRNAFKEEIEVPGARMVQEEKLNIK